MVRAPVADDSFSDLGSLDDLDSMVASLGLRASSLRMVLQGETLAPSKYTTAPRPGRGTEPQVSPGLVYRRFSEGATIVLESLHKYWRPLTDFCRELELALGQRLQVNAYITPPGSQGFAAHRDDHDVFVLQVSGTKHWIVYDRDDAAAVVIDEVLEPGSSLYIPKGFPHEARTAAEASAHLTVGILTNEAVEVLRALTRLAEAEPSFQERIPPVAMRDIDSLRAWAGAQIEEIRRWLDKVDLDDVTERVARRVLTTAQPILRGQLRQFELVGSVSEDTVVIRRLGAGCFVFRRPHTLRVLLADRELEMPLVAADAVEEIVRRERLTPRDLYPFLEPNSALVLVRRLVREGLLEVSQEE
ncbi:MAG TPA: cupin domain-containing protein [Actinomycetota bacterium]|nr:cupin domain-containing protein [Actinomycetota bacterium]